MNRERYEAWQRRMQERLAWRVIVRFCAIDIVFIPIVAGVLLLFFGDLRGTMLTAGLACLVAWSITQIIERITQKQRPYQEYGFRLLIGTGIFVRIHTIPNAFPSGHAGALSALTAVCILLAPFLGAVMLGITLLNGWARTVSGYHWPKDIVAGWVIGTIVGYCTYLLNPYLLPYFALLR